MIVILGAGLAGLSAAFHIGHDRCRVLEASDRPYGLTRSDSLAGFIWEQGPHVSFTKHEYVRSLFAASVDNDYLEFNAKVRNYHMGTWIDHPVQVHLHQAPEPLRSKCLTDFTATRDCSCQPGNYGEWLSQSFGSTFADAFPRKYTKKYWTVEPEQLTTDWIGERVYRPNTEEVIRGAQGPLGYPTYYITQVRYPGSGGFQSFAHSLFHGAGIHLNARVCGVDLEERIVRTDNGISIPFERLVNTLPLPEFVRLCRQAPPHVIDAAHALCCTEVLLVNVTAPVRSEIRGHWFYIYDTDKLSTRISRTEAMSPQNAPSQWTGVQVEVYASRYKKWQFSREQIADRVVAELEEMGVVPQGKGSWTNNGGCLRHIPYANVVFDHKRKESLKVIFSWLAEWGLEWEEEDLRPVTDWTRRFKEVLPDKGRIYLAGRFGQWKYFWTDDCVLQGLWLAARMGFTEKIPGSISHSSE